MTTDDALYLRAAEEIEANRPDRALWMRAFALEDGDPTRTKAHYIRLRVDKLRRDQPPPRSPEPEQPQTPHPLPRVNAPSNSGKPRDPLWTRFWARNIDLAVCMAIGLPLNLLLPTNGSALMDLVFGFFVIGAVLVLYEAALITCFGATLGKAIFGLAVQLKSGGNPPFSIALNRAVRAWAQGSGCYLFFPVVPAIAWWQARTTFKNTGETVWDRNCDTEVSQTPIRTVRWAAGALIGILCLSSVSVLAIILREVNKPSLRQSAVNPRKSAPSDPPFEYGFEQRKWSGNMFDQFNTEAVITAMARKKDWRFGNPAVWDTVRLWQSWHMHHNNFEANRALYRAVDAVLPGLGQNKLCFPGEDRPSDFGLPMGLREPTVLCSKL